ncbi:MAG: glycoside hydrolase domain-containing protein [PVC group bacterium]
MIYLAGMKKGAVIFILCLGFGLLPKPAPAQTPTPPPGISAVWANSGEGKITRDELRASADPGGVVNSVWDGTSVRLFGAKNEIVAFNLCLEAATRSAAGVTVSLNRLDGPGGSVIQSSATTGDGVFNWNGRDIELFYIRYLEIEGLSRLSYESYDERHIPKRFRRPWSGDGEGSGTWLDRPDHNKQYPEIAVPLELVPGFTIQTGQNQSIWCDIYIPDNAPAGLYTGSVTVTENGAPARQVPVELTVRDFTLPDLPSARTMLFISTDNINYRYLGTLYPTPGTSLYQQSLLLADRHFQLAHRHRVSLIDGYTDPADMDEVWADRLNGNLFTPARGYRGPGRGVGNNIYSIGTYGGWPWQGGGEAAMRSNTDLWANWFNIRNFSTPTEYFLYLIDESSDYPQIEEWAQWINNNPGPGRQVLSMATVSLVDGVNRTPSLDIPDSGTATGITADFQAAAASLLSSPDKRLWMYAAYRPNVGSMAIEDDGVSPRVTAWAQFKKQVGRWFYWESTYYDNFQGGTGQTNVFRSAFTFGGHSGYNQVLGETGWNYGNGDGVLFYPGTDLNFPVDSYGVNGPFASLRLKHWRRGIQDVDYLTLAAKVAPDRVLQIVSTMIPKILWECGVDDPTDPTWIRTDISWSTDPDVWEAARRELADIIEAGAAPVPHSGDYDGDGTDDIAVFRPFSGLWAVRGITRRYFGTSSARPVPGDYDGDGTTDIGVFRPDTGLWAIVDKTRFYFGREGDRPVPGDYDGNGICDTGIFRSGAGLWAIRAVSRMYFGRAGDSPVPGDYDGDGTEEAAVFRPAAGLWAVRGGPRIYFGGSADEPVPGDYDGNGTRDCAIFRPSLELWAIHAVTRIYFGNAADTPVSADYAGSGTDSIGIFRPYSGLWAIRKLTRVYYGTTGDIPVTR